MRKKRLINESSLNADVRLEVLRFLLGNEEVSIREMARRLRLPSSQVFYHVKKLTELGVLVRTVEGERVWYEPQPIFLEEREKVVETLRELSALVRDADDEKTANCLYYLLQVYNSK